MREFSETEEKILDTALAMVSESGSFNLTIRDLSERAEVNVAAINYHFKTKKNMLELVKEFYIKNTINAYSPIRNNELTDIEKLKVFSVQVIDYVLKYPGVTNLLKEIYDQKDLDEGFAKIVEVTDELNYDLDRVLRNVLGDDDEIEFQYKKNIFLSSLVYPATYMHMMRLDKSIMFEEDKKNDYIDYILNLLIE